MQTNPNPAHPNVKPVNQAPLVHEVLGIYGLGAFNVEVVLDWQEGGGCYYFAPDNRGLPRIRIGMDYHQWWEVLSVLLHETLEFIMDSDGHAWRKRGRLTYNSAERTFIMDHQEFAQFCGRAATFLEDVAPALRKRWTEVRGEKASTVKTFPVQ